MGVGLGRERLQEGERERRVALGPFEPSNAILPESCRSSLSGNVAAEVTRLSLRFEIVRSLRAVLRTRPRSHSDHGARTYRRRLARRGRAIVRSRSKTTSEAGPVYRGLQPPHVGCYVGRHRSISCQRADPFGLLQKETKVTKSWRLGSTNSGKPRTPRMRFSRSTTKRRTARTEARSAATFLGVRRRRLVEMD